MFREGFTPAVVGTFVAFGLPVGLEGLTPAVVGTFVAFGLPTGLEVSTPVTCGALRLRIVFLDLLAIYISSVRPNSR